MSQERQAPASSAQINASDFAIDQNLEYSLGYCEKKLYDISKEVELLQTRLQFLALEEERGQIAKRRARNRLQPVARLPDEILSSIVLISIMPCDALIWRAPALAISHRWRNCALSEPMIWRHVFIVPDTEEDELVTWLSRSQSTQLHVHFTLPDPQHDSQNEDEHFGFMQSLIAPYFPRMRSLVYKIDVRTNTLFPLNITTPSLKSLSITWEGDPALISPPDVFRDTAPSGLCDLHLDTRAYTRDQVVLNNFDASKLVRLRVGEGITIPSIWSTLTRSKLLRDLFWYTNDEDETEPLDVSALASTPVTLPNLLSLDVNSKICQPLLECLDSPAMQWLRISYTASTFQDLMPEILRRGQLRRLSLWDVGSLEASQIQGIFSACSQLEYFLHNAWTAESISALKTLTPPSSRRTKDVWSAPHLLVLLKESEALDAFLGLEGVQWDDNYTWPDE